MSWSPLSNLLSGTDAMRCGPLSCDESASCASAGASALEAMQKLVKDQNQALAKAQLGAQEAQAKARSLEERCQSLQEEAASLRRVLACHSAACTIRMAIPLCAVAAASDVATTVQTALCMPRRQEYAIIVLRCLGQRSECVVVAVPGHRQQLQRSEDLRQQGQRALGELKQEFDELTHDIAEGALDDSPAKPRPGAAVAEARGKAETGPLQAHSHGTGRLV